MKNNIYIVANFGEIFLKGANVSFFEEILYINLFEKVEHLKSKIVFEKKSGGAFFMKLKKDITESEIVEIEKAVATTPGFSTYYRAYFCDTDLEDIIKTSVMVAEKFLKSNPDIKTFGISTKKTEKNIGPKSNEVNVKVGSVIWEFFEASGNQLDVNLDNPDLKIFIKIKREMSFVFTDKKEAVGGLPIGSEGRVITMLSGGIDSPVASFLAMKRGLHITAIHFHSVPQTSSESIEKVKKLVKELSKFQKNIRLYLIPIIPVQRNIVSSADRKLSIILQRRAFLKMGLKIAEIEKSKSSKKIGGFVTGDCLGQVASQTMENMAAVSEVLDGEGKIIFRPLLTYDKKEIMSLAQKIGTLDISEETHEDTCSLFVPKKPETRADIGHTKKEELKLDDSILDEVIEKVEIFEV